MFDGLGFPKSLDEEVFDQWLEEGRESKLSYHYMLVIWDEADSIYKPVYLEERDKIKQYENYGEATGRESLIAAYDLYSESRIT
ncbi:hypothetical protein OO013_09685 [Mangrovivirga sp. M17]|uniref:Uncharacterized protein n=1 Tax=Mangrovivirga halotolerans TaxID=2993936 RepID=A0ABT3RQT5_9BACT|nr:hypothetical protein [Mangrovivirga halotolerans]MCX2744137.1 hypothetical protein [Mangrovivirga halotolerans]